MPQGTPGSHPFAFLNLPAELRIQIYDYVLISHTGLIRIQSRRTGNPNDPPIKIVPDIDAASTPRPSLLQTCRQILAEAHEIFYRSNKFVLEGRKAFECFLGYYGLICGVCRHAAIIQRLAISTDLSGPLTYGLPSLGWICKQQETISNLRELEIQVSPIDGRRNRIMPPRTMGDLFTRKYLATKIFDQVGDPLLKLTTRRGEGAHKVLDLVKIKIEETVSWSQDDVWDFEKGITEIFQAQVKATIEAESDGYEGLLNELNVWSTKVGQPL